MTKWLIRFDKKLNSWYVIPQFLDADCFKIYTKDEDSAGLLKVSLEKYQNNNI